jgi:hypothetical protein
MEATTKEKRPKAVIEEAEIGNVWEIVVKLKGSRGIDGFGGRMLGAYKHPLTGQTTHLLNEDGNPLVGFNISLPKMNLHPLSNRFHRIVLDWLLAHPEVTVEGAEISKEYSKVKSKAKGDIVLRNLDKKELNTIDEEEYIDILLGRISKDAGADAISLEKIRWLLSNFNLSYRDARFFSDAKNEKKHLRKKLKDFCRIINKDPNHPELKVGESNARLVSKILDNIENYKINYEIKEMVRLGIIRIENGIYRYSNTPLGTQIDSVIQFFRNAPEVYAESADTLYKMLKEERK